MTLKIPLELDENDEVHRAHLDAITGYVACASRVVAVTGAGISCSAGIPDFRSADGLYALVKERYPGQVVKGKDLFDAQLFRSAETTSLFLTFASELRRLSLQAQPTPGHQFLETLRQEGRLLRCYTQNIDDLEFRLPIPPSPTLYPKEQSSEIIEETDAEKKREEGVIQLHGTLSKARCTRCAMTRRCTAIELDAWAAGEAPECPYCLDVAAARALANKRTLAIGDLRPDIVLYNEDHPGGAKIAEAIQKDLRKRPDLLLVIGTSLKVHGARQLVKDAAKAVHKAGGISIYVSVTPLSWTEWGSVFDYWIGGPADEWV
ncbi:MAG: DHS-like NAD/FAD-binding domain-containing protein, partial [Piptocephalis tieghemiana]